MDIILIPGTSAIILNNIFSLDLPQISIKTNIIAFTLQIMPKAF